MGVSAPSLHRESTDSLIILFYSLSSVCTFTIMNFELNYIWPLTNMCYVFVKQGMGNQSAWTILKVNAGN